MKLWSILSIGHAPSSTNTWKDQEFFVYEKVFLEPGAYQVKSCPCHYITCEDLSVLWYLVEEEVSISIN